MQHHEELFRSWTVRDLANMPNPTDPQVCGVEHDEDLNCLTIRWGNYGYDIDLDRIRRPEDLLWWIHHLGKKTWPGMTPGKISALVRIVAHIRGWPEYGKVPHENEAPKAKPDVVAERAKMAPAIRYAVIRRDGYRCRACGFAVQDGAHLHVDHVYPVSKGGLTEMQNLQTLCTVCNLGKADK